MNSERQRIAHDDDKVMNIICAEKGTFLLGELFGDKKKLDRNSTLNVFFFFFLTSSTIIAWRASCVFNNI